MVLRRIIPSFTVEVRHTRRGKPEIARSNWAAGKASPPPPVNELTRVAADAFKPAVQSQVEKAPSEPPRILPSLIESAFPAEPIPETRGGLLEAAKRGRRRPQQFDETKPATPEDLAVDARTSPSPLEHVVQVSVDVKPRMEDGASRPMRAKKLQDGLGEEAKGKCTKRAVGSPVTRSGPEIAAVKSLSRPAADGKPVAEVRKSRVLDQYVFRDQLRPGDGWKRRIQTQRNRRC